MMVYACMNVASNGASDALAGDRIATPFAAAHESLSWHIATFRFVAEFSHYREIADIAQAAAIKLDL